MTNLLLKVFLFLTACVVMSADEQTCLLWEAHPKETIKGVVEVTFDWYGCQGGDVLVHYVPLDKKSMPQASKGAIPPTQQRVIDSAVKSAQNFIKNSAQPRTEVVKKDNKVLKVVVRFVP